MSNTPNSYHHHQKLDTLLFHQVNVGKGGPNMDIALQQAWEAEIHVVMVQEPWTMRRNGDFITKSHTGFDSFIPFGNTAPRSRPRAITFVRKGLQAAQIRPSSSSQTSDYCFVQVSGLTFVNVYRAPGPSGTLDPLLNWQPVGPSIVGGDFNSVSQHWQPQVERQYGNGDLILGWAHNNNMQLVSTIGESTHRDGNVLDLTWSNTTACASVSSRFHCTSDHSTIEGSVDTPGKSKLAGIPRLIRVKDSDLDEFARYVKQWVRHGALSSPTEIEAYTGDLIQVLQDAVTIVGRAPAVGRGRTAPWWNNECKRLHTNYRIAKNTSGNVELTRREFRAAVKSAKREYWTQQVEAAESETQVFKLMRWAKPKPAKDPPPLQVSPNQWVSDPLQRTIALRDSLLARFNAGNDINTWEDGQLDYIPWDGQVTLEDVTAATIGCKETAPGHDKITVRLLKACWRTIGSHIRDLFQACLDLEYFPTPFKVAEVVLLPKTGRDLTSPKGWRPISLLSSLGKGLERLVAKRMSWLAIKYKVVHPQLFGALPGRSAVDLVSCVIHDAEAAMRSNKVTAIVTLDIQGAFDAVLHNRLLSRMRGQGWPLSLCRWVESFLSQRKVMVRYKEGVTDEKLVECGVPQGSPLSPLLFMLYISTLFEDGSFNCRFGYADDISVVRVGKNPREAVEAAQEEVDRITQLALTHKIQFDASKSELLIIGGGPKKKLDTSDLTVRIGDQLITPSPKIRWLGVWLDSQLTFRQHVQEWSSKAQRLSNFLRSINKVQRGAAPGPLVRAVNACVVSTALYGAEAWWPGLTRITTKRDKKVSTGIGWHTKLLDRTILTAIRAALPVWRTTPNIVLHRESGILPAEVLLQQKQLRNIARIRRLDSYHPLATRANETPKDAIKRLKLREGQNGRVFRVPERYSTRLQNASHNLPASEAPDELRQPRNSRATARPKCDKKEKAKQIQIWLGNLPAGTICVYTDGSSTGPAVSAYGYAVYKDTVLIASGGKFLPGAEIYDAEITGAVRGLEAALEFGDSAGIKVLLDNQEAVEALESGRTNSSIEKVRIFKDLCGTHPMVEVRWIPGHQGIKGNEKSDMLAKRALASYARQINTSTTDHAIGGRQNILTMAALKRQVSIRSQTLAEEWWLKNRTDRYENLDLLMRRKRPPELGLPRWAYHRLIAARTGHGDFASYHRRFQHENVELLCKCGREKRPWHFAECRLAIRKWRTETKELPPRIRDMIGQEGWQVFWRFITVTKCYSRTEF